MPSGKPSTTPCSKVAVLSSRWIGESGIIDKWAGDWTGDWKVNGFTIGSGGDVFKDAFSGTVFRRASEANRDRPNLLEADGLAADFSETDLLTTELLEVEIAKFIVMEAFR